MKRIWAPWRIEYIKGPKEKGCIFCLARDNDGEEKKRLVIAKSPHSIAMLNKFPYIGGHVMIAPNKHVGSLDKLGDDERLDLMRGVDDAIAALKKTMKPDGFNVGINLGRVAGAGIPKHVHIHVVPRWNGDTNFIPVLGDARLINEHLEITHQKLSAAWARAPRKGRAG